MSRRCSPLAQPPSRKSGPHCLARGATDIDFLSNHAFTIADTSHSDSEGPFFLGGEAWSPEPRPVERFWSAEEQGFSEPQTVTEAERHRCRSESDRARSNESGDGTKEQGDGRTKGYSAKCMELARWAGRCT